MSITDPHGGAAGGVVSGGIIVEFPGGVIVTVVGTGFPRISYNGKNVDLPKTPFDYIIDPLVPRTVHSTLIGTVDTLLLPRMDVHVHAKFRPSVNLPLMFALENWWQWAQHGELFDISFNSAKVVRSSLTFDSPVGTSLLTVSSSVGFVVGDYYVMKSGSSYQVVRVLSISGNDITIYGTLNFTFVAGALVRDLYFWQCLIRDQQAPLPVRPVLDFTGGGYRQIPNAFELEIDFYETL